MVKELTMDNSIFAIGAKGTEASLTTNKDVASGSKFANVFETAKTTNKNNYIDKTNTKQNNENVVNVAEKSVNRGEKSSNNSATDITKVNKKVSKKLTKSPSSATNHSADTTKSVRNGKTTSSINSTAVHGSNVSKTQEPKITNDAYTYSVKAEIQSADVVDTKLPVEQVQTEEVAVEAPVVIETSEKTEVEIPVDNSVEVLNETSTVVEDINATVVQQLLSENSVKESVDLQIETPNEEVTLETETTISTETENSEVVDLVSDKFSSIEVDTEETSGITLSQDKVANSDEKAPTVDVDVKQNSDIELNSLSVADSDSESITLDENWVAVDKEESDKILKDMNLTSSNKEDLKSISTETEEMTIAQQDVQKVDDSEVENVVEDIEIQDVDTLSQTVENNAEVETDIDTAVVTGGASNITEQEEVVESVANKEIQTSDEKVNVDLKEDKDLTLDNKVQTEEVVELEETNPVNEVQVSDDTQIVDDVQVEKVPVKPELNKKDVEVVEKATINNIEDKEVALSDTQEVQEITFNSTQKVADAIEKVATTTRPTVSSSDEEEDDDDGDAVASDLLLGEVEEVAEVEEVVVTQETELDADFLQSEKEFEKELDKTVESYANEDLDLYIDNCVKLAFVDTTAQVETEEIDVISALETKFEETFAQEDIDFADEYENVSSLEELVDDVEVEALGLRLKDSTIACSISSENTVSTITASTTTEQLIRYSIEGDSFTLDVTPQFEFSKFAPESVKTAQPEVSGKEILAQLSEKLATFSFKAGSKLTMQLNPENLGKIELTLKNTAEGIIAEMSASTDDAADMLKKNLEDLKEALQKYGVRFDNVSVKTMSTQQSPQGQDYTQQEGNQRQQQEQKRDSEKHDKKQFDEMMNSFTEEDKE